jgi:polar amino acid transport system permease protein
MPDRSSPAKPSTRAHLLPLADRLERLPYWLLLVALGGVVGLWRFAADAGYRVIFTAVARGLATTMYVSLAAYLLSIVFGLALGLLRVSRLRAVRELATFWVEVIRGIPMLVILYYIAFVGAPALVELVNWLTAPLQRMGLAAPLSVRRLDFTGRAILALTIGYGAFISEIFRAGIQSVHPGQMEAALALGMRRWQAMRRVVLPQAVRNVLPALGNELVAMVKDSALVSALGVQDITQLGKVYSASTFRFFETYNVVAFLYLCMTITLSLLVRRLERRLGSHRRRRPRGR